MNAALNSIWDAIKKARDLYIKEETLQFDISDSKRDSFFVQFRDNYENIKRKYMKPDVETLDRHKVAAIIICTIIEQNIVTTSKHLNDDTIFLGSEMIALSIGLSYMQRALNDVLYAKGETKFVSSFSMPSPITCNTEYFDILARNLYFSKRDYKLNPLDIADKLFLIEYLTLKEKMIDPQILRNK